MGYDPSGLDRRVRSAFVALCDEVATPFAYRASLMLEENDWVGLTSLEVDPRRYTCVATYAGEAQVASFFRKCAGFNTGRDLEGDAIKSFYANEAGCFWTNERLGKLIYDPRAYGERLFGFIQRVRKEIKTILGRAPSVSQLEGRHGPGATFADRAPLTTVPDKMSTNPTLTPGARIVVDAFCQTAWYRHACALESSSDFAFRVLRLSKGNRFTTVAKDSRKRRGICIEPSVNIFYQLALGRWMRRRLKAIRGLDLDIAAEDHRVLAQLGSEHGFNATIDLSNASDTVCKALVKLLLPSDWYSVLAALRSPSTFIDGKWVRLEKFSSMGNGYTFELETILFFAIARICSLRPTVYDDVRDRVSVFGDDIIVPNYAAHDVVAALKFFGFTPNKDKTFLEGPFRESCGGDYFQGKAVRPHFLKELPSEPQHFIALANGLRRARGFRPDAYRVPWLRVLEAIPKCARDCNGPEQLGDLVIHNDEARWQVRTRNSIRYIRVWRPVRRGNVGWSHFRPGVVFASALYGVGDGARYLVGPDGKRRPAGEGVLGRASRVDREDPTITGYKPGWVPYS